MFSLKGKTALVTGARTGIGKAIAVGLAQAGADLVVLGHSPDFAEVTAEAEAVGAGVETIIVDLADPDSVEPALAGLLARREVDVLVNNAGIIHRQPATDVSLSDWRRVQAVNLDSVFALSQAVGRQMTARGSGKVITIASLLSFQGGINVSGYTTSKHAVAGLTKALANEWAPRGVNVNAIAPGYIATDNTQALRDDSSRATAILERIPAGRWGSADDIGGAAVFLASDAAAYVHGTVLPVDGGWLGR